MTFTSTVWEHYSFTVIFLLSLLYRKRTELWLQNRGTNRTVNFVYRYSPVLNRPADNVDAFTFCQLRITWGHFVSIQSFYWDNYCRLLLEKNRPYQATTSIHQAFIGFGSRNSLTLTIMCIRYSWVCSSWEWKGTNVTMENKWKKIIHLFISWHKYSTHDSLDVACN